jgi:hypothetical protein
MGGELLLAVTQKLKTVGLKLMVSWAQAVSKVPNAASSTKANNAMDLKGVFTRFSSEGW